MLKSVYEKIGHTGSYTYNDKLFLEFSQAHELGHAYFRNNLKKDYDLKNVFTYDKKVTGSLGNFVGLREEINAELVAWALLKEKHGKDFETIKEQLIKTPQIAERVMNVSLKESHNFASLYQEILHNPDFFKDVNIKNPQAFMEKVNDIAIRTVNTFYINKDEIDEKEIKDFQDTVKKTEGDDAIYKNDYYNLVKMTQKQNEEQEIGLNSTFNNVKEIHNNENHNNISFK